MKKWKLWFLSALMPLMLASNGYLSGTTYDDCYYPSNWDLCNQRVVVGLDFIYWKPCIDDLDVAAFLQVNESQQSTDRSVDYKCMCLDWEPGIRASLTLPGLFCDWDFFASYAYLHSCDRASQRFEQADGENGIVSPLLFTAIPDTFSGPFAEGKESWDLCYHEWDALLSHNILCGKCHHFSPYFGIAGIYLDQALKAQFNIQVLEQMRTRAKWDSEYWGVGLRFGTYYEYAICDNLGLFANANASLLAGEARSINKQQFRIEGEEFTDQQTIRFKDSECCLFVPGYRIAAGFNYAGCLCDYEIGARLGYEFVYWHNVPNQRVFCTDADDVDMLLSLSPSVSHTTSPSTRTLGFHGLVAGISLSF